MHFKVMLVGAAAGLALAVGLVAVSTSPAVAAPTQPFRVAMPANAKALKVIEQAIASAPSLPCVPVFYIEPTPGISGSATSDCTVRLDPSSFDKEDLVWYAPYVVRHEVAHIATLGHGHDALFRSVLATMLKPIHLTEHYGATGVYPETVEFKGKCVLGCTS